LLGGAREVSCAFYPEFTAAARSERRIPSHGFAGNFLDHGQEKRIIEIGFNRYTDKRKYDENATPPRPSR